MGSRDVALSSPYYSTFEKENIEDNKEESKDQKTLVEFFTKALGDKVSSVNLTRRSINSPAIIIDHESSSYRKMMQYVNDSSVQGKAQVAKQKLEINPEHIVCKKLAVLKDINPDMATLIAEQVFDNALMAADILDKPQMMLDRLNKILEHASEAN